MTLCSPAGISDSFSISAFRSAIESSVEIVTEYLSEFGHRMVSDMEVDVIMSLKSEKKNFWMIFLMKMPIEKSAKICDHYYNFIWI